MAPINAMLNELRLETLKVALLNGVLDATILFLALFLILSVFSIGLLIPLLVALLFLIIDVWRHMRRISLRYIEERNPVVREMLRTAADNKESQTLMAHALFSDLGAKLREVSGGTLIDFHKIGFKLVMLFTLSFIIVSLAFFNVNIQKFENPLARVGDALRDYWTGLLGERNLTADIGGDEMIYGDPSLAKLGNQALDIQLRQNLNQLDFNKVSDAEAQSANLESYPVDVSATSSAAYTGGLEDVNDRKAAAEYSQQVKK